MKGSCQAMDATINPIAAIMTIKMIIDIFANSFAPAMQITEQKTKVKLAYKNCHHGPSYDEIEMNVTIREFHVFTGKICAIMPFL